MVKMPKKAGIYVPKRMSKVKKQEIMIENQIYFKNKSKSKTYKEVG